MIQKLLGGALVFAGCAGVGFMKADQLRKEEALLADTVRLMTRMENEVSCRRTSLPKLCELAEDCRKELKNLYICLAQHLSMQTMPNVTDCMSVALKQQLLPQSVSDLHSQLGQTLGKFDLDGQLRELETVRKTAEAELKSVREIQKDKQKSYQTLGLCAGAALVILLV